MKFNVENPTVNLMGIIVVIAILVSGFSLLKILPFDLTAGIINAIIMVLAGTIILLEVRFGKGGFQVDKAADALMVFVAIIAYILAFAFFGMPIIPPMLVGAIATLYLFIAAVTFFSLVLK